MYNIKTWFLGPCRKSKMVSKRLVVLLFRVSMVTFTNSSLVNHGLSNQDVANLKLKSSFYSQNFIFFVPVKKFQQKQTNYY